MMPVSVRWVVRALSVAGLFAGAAPALGAQDYVFQPTVQWQGRADVASSARGSALLLGGGANVPAGYYVRLGLDGVAGPILTGGTTRVAARVDLTARFLLDPFAEARVGWYAGGGVAASHDGTDLTPYLTLLVGREGPTAGRWRSAVELGVGGGVRLGVVIRRTRQNGR